MFDNLRTINNPLLRSAVAGLTAFSTITIISALAIEVVNPQGKSTHKLGVSASLLAASGGAVFGLVSGGKKSSQTQKQLTHVSDREWQDWRNFVVTRKVKESEEITSFYLKPQDKGEIPDFKPGQFLTIKLDIPEQQQQVIRTYSLSDYTDGDYYRLSIKRENMPKDLNVPPGVASNFMHDRIEEGSAIALKPPNGKFVLDIHKSTPAVLMSNGVGITPMVSMAKACSRLNPNRHIWFLHGAKNGDYHAFREEMAKVAESNPNLHLYYQYSRPRPEDEGYYRDRGYVDKDLLEKSVIPEIEKICGSNDAEYFLCGSRAFMDSLLAGLKALGVSESRISFESFGSGAKVASEPRNHSAIDNRKDNKIESAEVVFARSNLTRTWRAGDGTLLEFAEANGINPDYSCRQGICQTCTCQLKEGEVEYIESPAGTLDDKSVLICISRPKTTKIVLDF
jgi:ferredoxin-NADP reductase